MRKYLFGAGLGLMTGGIIGLLVLPIGFYSLLAFVCIIEGGFIAYSIWGEYYGARNNSEGGV